MHSLYCLSTLNVLQSWSDVQDREEALEQALQAKIATYRSSSAGGGRSTQFDDALSFYMSPALEAYEYERLTGTTFGNAEFQQSVKRCVPAGHTFKGFPISFQTDDSNHIFDSLQGQSVAADILDTHGDEVYFAVRSRIVPYPEGRSAVWVMIAVKFCSVVA